MQQRLHQVTPGTPQHFQAKPNSKEMHWSFIIIIEYLRGFLVCKLQNDFFGQCANDSGQMFEFPFQEIQ